MNGPWILCARHHHRHGYRSLLNNGILSVWPVGTSREVVGGFFVYFGYSLYCVGLVTAYWLEYGVSFVGNGSGSFRWAVPVCFPGCVRTINPTSVRISCSIRED